MTGSRYRTVYFRSCHTNVKHLQDNQSKEWLLEGVEGSSAGFQPGIVFQLGVLPGPQRWAQCPVYRYHKAISVSDPFESLRIGFCSKFVGTGIV